MDATTLDRSTSNVDARVDVEQLTCRVMALTRCCVVELPGIEPAPEIAMSCGNAESDYAKQRQPTRNDRGCASGVDGIYIPKHLEFDSQTAHSAGNQVPECCSAVADDTLGG
jgi:hypothetical protein